MKQTENTEINTWMIRSGGGGFLMDEFMEKDIVAIGWNELGEIPQDITYPALKNRYKEIYPDSKAGSINQNCSQIWRFINDMKIGDNIVTYDPIARRYYLGATGSSHFYDPKLQYHHYRKVDWGLGVGIERDLLSVEAKNTLGSVLTVFLVPKTILEELEKAHPEFLSDEDIKAAEEEFAQFEEEELDLLKSDVVSKSTEFIKDLIVKLSWQQTEQLVGGILKAMGYRTRFTSRGSDLGSDIFASPDGLGLEEPRIKIEVKKRTNDRISAPEIRNFVGGMRTNEKGIFVATTGFSKEARYEAERANFAITLIDSDLLVELIVENYEQLSSEIKALIPLRKIYWPV